MLKMKITIVFFILISCTLKFTISDMRFVNYSVISNVNVGPRRQACAQSYADNNYFAVKIYDVTGFCEGLNWTWGSNQTFDFGYTYLKKTKTIEIYQPSLIVSSRFQWLIPGVFNIGGRFDMYISVPTGDTWQGFEINLVDTVNKDFTITGNQPETLMVHIHVTLSSLKIKTLRGYIWHDHHSVSMPFVGGMAFKISLAPKENNMEVSIDDNFATEFEHRVAPQTAKQISLSPYSNTAIGLYNITFVTY